VLDVDNRMFLSVLPAAGAFPSLVPAAELMKDFKLRWSITYTRQDFEACADALSRDAALARAMVTDVVGLGEAPAAFETLRSGKGGGGKLLIAPWS
jgi:threonine dehydrogenase-like Zn-dependent dehydrogenase